MSVSLCINCEAGVGAYEKYCHACIAKYGVIQDKTWHQSHRFDDWDVERKAEFKKDLQLVQPRVRRIAIFRPTEPEPVKEVVPKQKRHRHKPRRR